MDNPIKKRIDELSLSTYDVAKIVNLEQPSVWRHYTGQRRLSSDSMVAYNSRLQVNFQEMLRWNSFLKEETKRKGKAKAKAKK